MNYVDPRSKVLAHIDRIVGWRQGRRVAPVTVEWDLSNRCVLGCQDCHFAHTHTRGPWVSKDRRLPMAFDACGDLADHAVVRRGLRDMKHAGVQGIVWSGGGEPTTHPDWVSIVEYAAHLGFQQGMYTLGGLLTPQSAARLSSLATWVVVSLDCPDAQTYAAEKGVPPERFDRACEGIRNLSHGSAVLGVSFLLHARNWQRTPEMLALSRSLGATYTTFRPAIHFSADRPAICSDDTAWITDALPAFHALAEETDVEIDPDRFVAYRDWHIHGRTYEACRGIQLNATVTPDGRVWVCPNRRGYRDSCLGDLSKESFSTIWARHPMTWTDFRQCRVMCRLHLVNEQMDALARPQTHEAFV